CRRPWTCCAAWAWPICSPTTTRAATLCSPVGRNNSCISSRRGPSMVDIGEMLNDLAAESAEVDALVAGLPADGWATPTPAAGWTVAHQVGHLAWTDAAAHLAMTDPDAFTEHASRALSELDGYVDRGAEEYLDEPAAMLERWRAGRAQVLADLVEVPPGVKIAWYGTSMAAPSLATARLLETWAHRLDIAGALR